MRMESWFVWPVCPLCVFIVFPLFASHILAHQFSQLCNSEMLAILRFLSDHYLENLYIMQHISSIAMYFAGTEGWEDSLMSSGIVQKIKSFTYAVCQTPMPFISLSASVYPLISIAHNLSFTGCCIMSCWWLASGVHFIFQYHLLSCIEDIYTYCRGNSALSNEICRLLLRLTLKGLTRFLRYS